ncbi:MAG: ROK family protein [Candidatus Kryptoniota bacterium]
MKNNKKHAIIGVDIGGTKTAVVLASLNAQIISRIEFATGADRDFPIYFGDLELHIQQIFSLSEYEIKAISVSIGGPLDVMSGVIKSPPNLPRWVNVPLKKILKERFNVPVYIEHDGNAGALAEYFFGAGVGCKNLVFLTLGTGFGAGIILDGRLYRGTTFLAGEIGHIRAAEFGPEAYGKTGSFEAYCSGSGMSKLSAVMFPERWPDGISARKLGELAFQGDTDAISVLHQSGKYLGRAFALIADILNPEMIILGPLGFRLGQFILGPAMEEFKKEALDDAFNVCRVVPAKLGEEIGDIASICAALDQGELYKP